MLKRKCENDFELFGKCRVCGFGLINISEDVVGVEFFACRIIELVVASSARAFSRFICFYYRILLYVCVASRGEFVIMGIWMGLCCLFVIRFSFFFSDLYVVSRVCSLVLMLFNRKYMVWLMEYRND